SSASSKSVYSDVLISPGKRTGRARLLSNLSRLRPPDKSPGGATNFIRDSRFGRHKFRREPREQPDEIMRHQDLAIAMRTGADADRRDLESDRAFARSIRSYDIE